VWIILRGALSHPIVVASTVVFMYLVIYSMLLFPGLIVRDVIWTYILNIRDSVSNCCSLKMLKVHCDKTDLQFLDRLELSS